MTPFKSYIAEQLLYKKYHFKCDCLFPMDFIGVVKDYKISNGNIVFIVQVAGGDKLIEIDENHPKMTIEKV